MSFERVKRFIVNGIYVLVGVVLITVSINSFFLKLKNEPYLPHKVHFYTLTAKFF